MTGLLNDSNGTDAARKEILDLILGYRLIMQLVLVNISARLPLRINVSIITRIFSQAWKLALVFTIFKDIMNHEWF